MAKLDLDALAESGDVDLDAREGVQPVTADMIRECLRLSGELPPESARPFVVWLDENWNGFNEDGDLTNGQVIAGALAYWRGQ